MGLLFNNVVDALIMWLACQEGHPVYDNLAAAVHKCFSKETS